MLLVAPALGPGCGGRQLMPTPNIYVGHEARNPFADVPPELQSTEVDVLYATNRAPLEPGTAEERLDYGTDRSRSLVFGSCRVRIGEADLTWDKLVADSQTHDRSHSLPLSITAVKEAGRFPETPMDVVATKDRWEFDPAALRRQAEARELLQGDIRRRLALTPRKDVFIYVHGVANTFETSVFTTAEFWHFAGRLGVPIAFTWPAKGSYAYDRESGEFAIYHLKVFLGLVAAVPEVKNIHLVAHSRGTDIVTTALRELFIEARGAKENARQKYKIQNLVLAAPDLDFSVILQRLTAEQFGPVIGRGTIYASKSDKAIGLSGWLFSSGRRLGQLGPEDIPPALRNWWAITKAPIAIIDADVSRGFLGLGHSYFRDNSAVSSDLILVLSENRDPGAVNGRPLLTTAPNFWKLDDDYLSPDARVLPADSSEARSPSAASTGSP